MSPEVCPFCSEEPCICPIFDLPEEPEDPDDPICPDYERGPEVEF